MDHGRVGQVPAFQVGEGDRIVQPDGTATAPVMTVDWVDHHETSSDDVGAPGRAVLWLDDGDSLDLPAESVLSVIWHEDARDVPLTRPEVVGDDTDPVVVLIGIGPAGSGDVLERGEESTVGRFTQFVQ